MLPGIFQWVLEGARHPGRFQRFVTCMSPQDFFGGFEDLAVEELSFSLLRGAWVFGAFGFTVFGGFGSRGFGGFGI